MTNRLDRVPKAVLFDMDGTMFDTEKIGWDGFLRAFKAYGYDVSDELSQRLIGCTYPMMQQILTEEFGEDLPLDEIMKIREVYMDEYLKKNGVPEKPGLRSLISYLVENDIPIGVVSANRSSQIYRYLRMAGLAQFVDTVICAQDLANPKPDPMAYLKGAHALDVAPEDCLVVEDSPIGAQAGINAGMPTVMIPDMVAPTAEIRKEVVGIYPNLYRVVQLLKDAEAKSKAVAIPKKLACA